MFFLQSPLSHTSPFMITSNFLNQLTWRGRGLCFLQMVLMQGLPGMLRAFRSCLVLTHSSCDTVIERPCMAHASACSVLAIMLPRLVQSRAATGSFYVKDVTGETVEKVKQATGIDDIQAHLCKNYHDPHVKPTSFHI